MWLIKIGNKRLEAPYILDHTYAVENVREVLFAEATLDGVLHEVVSPHARHIVTFSTGFLTTLEIAALRKLLAANYTDAAARRLNVTYYDLETAAYAEGDFKITGMNYGVLVSAESGIFVRPVTLTLTEY